jgi:hypothetical protein
MSGKAIVLYANFETVAGVKFFSPAVAYADAMRDADDWPVLACAMPLGCPVWTEDADFFGTGVATWTTDRIELYFQ